MLDQRDWRCLFQRTGPVNGAYHVSAAVILFLLDMAEKSDSTGRAFHFNAGVMGPESDGKQNTGLWARIQDLKVFGHRAQQPKF